MRLSAKNFWKPLTKRQPKPSDFMPWLDLVAPGVVLNDDHSLQATMAFIGPDLKKQPEEVQAAAMLQVNNALLQLDWGWSSHSETHRFFMPVPPRVTTWQHPIAARVGEEHHASIRQARLLESQHYVTVRYAPPSTSMAWIESKVYRTDGQRPSSHAPLWHSYLAAFQTTVHHLAQLLRGVMVEVEVLDDQAVWDYLGRSLNLRWWHETLPGDTHYLAEQLDDTDVLMAGDRPSLDGRYIRTLTLHRFPHMSVALMLAALNESNVEYSWALRWIPYDVISAQKNLRQQQKTHWFHRRSMGWNLANRLAGEEEGGDDPMSEHSARQVMDAQVFIGTDQGRLGKVTVTVTCWDEDWEVSEQKIQALYSTLVSRGFGAKIESTNALGAFFGSRPGLVQPNPRKPTVHSVTATHMLAVDAVYCGPSWNEHWTCGPFFIATTAKSNPYRYVSHPGADAAAHTFFDGPNGSGKSAWKDNLRMMCQQVPEIQDIGYDVKGSSMVTTLCLGGRFDDLGKGDVSLQPYRYIDQPAELQWAHEWTMQWLRDLNVPVDPYLYRAILSTLDRLSHVEPSARTISGFLEILTAPHQRQQVQFHKVDEDELHRIQMQRDRIRTALQPFRGGLLDGSYDGVTIQRVHTFELETLLDMPMVAKPVLRVVDHQVTQALDGRPTILWYDELQALLDLFESIEVLNQRLRRARDKNVMILAGTQNNEDILKHTLGPSFLNNCTNFVFFPNSKALSEQNVQSYTAFGLTYPEIQSLASAIPRAQWLHKSEFGSRLVEHRFGPLAQAVCGRSGKRWHRVVQEVLAHAGTDGFLDAWIERMGVGHATNGDDHRIEHVLAGV